VSLAPAYLADHQRAVGTMWTALGAAAFAAAWAEGRALSLEGAIALALEDTDPTLQGQEAAPRVGGLHS
jgi:hypothetical protein